MPFIPVVPAGQSTSPRARELSRRIDLAIEGFRQEHPDLKSSEIRQAMRLSLAGAGGGFQSIAVLIGVALAILGGLFAFFASRASGEGEDFPVLVIIAAAVLIALIVAAIRRSS